LLNWRPTVSLETGLKETIPHFARKLKEENYPVSARPNF